MHGHEEEEDEYSDVGDEKDGVKGEDDW